MKPHPRRITLVAAAIAAALPVAAHAVRIDYTLDAGVERDDNVTLSETDPVEQTIFRAGLGFAIEQNSSAVQARISGRLDHRRYEDIYANATDRMLEGRLNWMVIPDRLGLVVEDSYGVQTIDRFEPDSPNNRQQINVLSLGPDLHFNLGNTLRGRAELRFINSDAEVTEDFNSDRIAAALRAVKDLDATSTLSVNLQMQDVDFDNDLFARDHKRYEAYASYNRRFNRLDMLLDAGYARLDYDDGQTRNNPLLRAELGWRMSERSRFSVNAANQFSDAASGALGAIASTESGIPPSVLTGRSTITPSAYEQRSLNMGYEYTGVRTIYSISGNAQKIDYVDPGESGEESRGVSVELSYRLRPSLTLRGAASRDRTETDPPFPRRENNRLYSLGLEKQWSRHWSSSLSYNRYERSTASGTSEFKQNVIYLSIAYRNR
ncbi:hypothetical protein MMG85_09020 [Pseudoxanthomonas sp. LH2527]|uniref:hypothetical protein n=1 Tax=Pseudoxanthomonas sp. LH2527 TaxID=2923249 RepID=UPI001F13BCD5|nr:hypothetical protein [Pseudoxanthomonas sp. LH2527]MCH6483706.1 hypothetical protein [Pseudoxanthomonas sp. LH2527]